MFSYTYIQSHTRTNQTAPTAKTALLSNSSQFIMRTCYIGFLIYLMTILIIIGCKLVMQLQQGPSYEFCQSSDGDNYKPSTSITQKPKHDLHSSQRKLLVHGACTDRDISISQSRDSSAGIPQYIVQIVNTCISGCAPSNIHLHCGWFASARMVNPKTFKRLSYDDCLVNGGKPLKTSQIIRFTYSNSFMYVLQFKSAKFC